MFQRCFELQKAVLSYCRSCLIEYKCFLLHVADSGLLLTKQSIRRTGAVLNVLQGEEGASTNGKTHSRAVEPYRTGALFTRRRRRLYYSENVYHDARAADSSKVIKYRI